MLDQSSSGHALLVQLKDSCVNFDITIKASITSLVATLESLATSLAQSEKERVQLGAVPALWPDLRKLWRDLARAQLTFWDGDDSEGEDGESSKKKEQDLRMMCGSLAKFTRNLVAGVAENQNCAFENEPDIRRLLHYYTSWSAMEDSDSIPVARTLAQALSNMVTGNEQLLAKLWDTYMNLPEDQVILIRLLAFPDSRTLLTAFIFVLNCIHESRKRAKMLSRTAIGIRVCISLLDSMVRLYDAEEFSEGAQAFDVGYNILTQLIEQGLVPDLYSKFTIPDEIITPHQTTLLKIVDSYLQSIHINAAKPTTSKITKMHAKLSPILAKTFFTLSGYAQNAVERALRHQVTMYSDTVDSPKSTLTDSFENPTPDPAPPSSPMELDVMLPKVCEALVLVTQCIITVALEADEHRNNPGPDVVASVPEMDLKEFFNESYSSGHGLVENILELLRLFDLFLPRINFGKPVINSPSTGDTPTQQSITDTTTGFQYLKRDLVRLLGILSHDVKTVQHRVRDCGGIQIVMNLCVIDERNPYLREHAIFTLHNLLKGNPENQAVVDAMKPTGEWDEGGVLGDTLDSAHK